MKKKILVICALIIVISVSLIMPLTAYADYTDIINSSNSVVYFNQIFKNENSETNSYGGVTRVSTNYTYRIYGTATVSDYIYSRVTDLDSSHIYFFNSYNNSVDFRVTSYSNSVQSPFIFSGLSYFQYAINYYAGTTYDITIQPILIDLTSMFGSGNEPTLTQCQELFVADYYAYNSGTAMSFYGLNAYADGVLSVLNTLDTSFTSETIVSTAQPYTYNYKNSKIVYYALDGSDYPPTQYTDILCFYNACYVPFMTTLDAGSTITITDTYFSEYNVSADIMLGIFALTTDNNLVKLGAISIDGITTSYTSLSYDIQIDSYGLVFAVLDSTNYYVSIGEPTISFRTNNVAALLNNSYQTGYDAAKTYYNSYYGENGLGYYEIYRAGWNAGHDAPEYDFKYLITAVVDTPIQAFINLFDFEILGYNMKTFYLSVFTLCVIFLIIKMVI